MFRRVDHDRVKAGNNLLASRAFVASMRSDLPQIRTHDLVRKDPSMTILQVSNHDSGTPVIDYAFGCAAV
jgi:hypothetical protein